MRAKFRHTLFVIATPGDTFGIVVAFATETDKAFGQRAAVTPDAFVLVTVACGTLVVIFAVLAFRDLACGRVGKGDDDC